METISVHRILILEDSELDKELIVEKLIQAGYHISVTHVTGEPDFRTALETGTFDIILSDFNLPGFDAFGALEICQEVCPEVPFICVSGGIGEETAVELLKKGAVDYVMKDKPGRLPFTIQRALDEAKEKQSRQLAEQTLTLLNRAVESSSLSIVITDINGVIQYVNPYFLINTGYSRDEVLGNNPRILKSGNQSREFYNELWQTVLSGEDWFGEFQNIKKNGDLYWEQALISPIRNTQTGEITHFVAIKEDITDKKSMLKNLVAMLNDKERLIQELFHRSYNNMQVILAYIEYTHLLNPDLSLDRFLHDVKGQIQSMVLAHRQLNKGNHLSKIDLATYLETLVNEIVVHNRTTVNVQLTFDLVPVQVLLDSAVPLGTIINQLLSNLVLFAFPSNGHIRTPAEIRVMSSVSESDLIEVSLHDNGVSWATSNGRNALALAMVKEQLGGTISIEEATGTTIRITFTDNRYTERI